MAAHQLSRTEARRIAVRAQLLDKAADPAGLLDVVRQLSMLQDDRTAAVAPSAELVLWSRLGSGYQPADLARALESGQLIELDGHIRPRADIALYRADMAEWPGRGELREWQEDTRDWVDANNGCRTDILDRLRLDGPLTSQDLPDTCDVPWRSSGWNNNRNVSRLIDMMVRRGEIAMCGWAGRDRLWDLAERIYPDDPPVPYERARLVRNERRLAALGIARATGSGSPVEPVDVGEAGEPAVVEGVRGAWRVDPAQLGRPFSGRAAVLSPLDRLVYDRKRMVELFEFDYRLEMYKPAAKRRWGYFALPILYGDRLVGKVDATADRDVGVLRVDAVHRDMPFSKAMDSAVDREMADLARFLSLALQPAQG